jgi:hypothetical protein
MGDLFNFEHMTDSTFILSTLDDWEMWLSMIKARFIMLDIWEYINPDTPDDQLPTLEEPVCPTAKDSEGRMVPASQLTPDERYIYDIAVQLYPSRREAYDLKREHLRVSASYIKGRVARQYRSYTNHAAARDILLSLQKKSDSSTVLLETEWLIQYEALKTTPKASQIEAYLTKWHILHDKGVKRKLGWVRGNRMHHDFVDAVASLNPDFSTYWTGRLIECELNGDTPQFRTVLKNFRAWMQLQSLRKLRKAG